MKYQVSKFLWGALLFSIATLLQVGCISESTDPTNSPEPTAEVEKSNDDNSNFPLENLRMDPTTSKMLANLKAATAKYHDLAVAEAAGYAIGSPCVSVPNLGGMGFHYVNGNLLFDEGTFDPTQPEALLYEMDKNGNMKLVGVEFIIEAEFWDGEEIPHFGSKKFDEVSAPYPLPFDNYQLHVWVWRHNPNGIFTNFNPNVTCL